MYCNHLYTRAPTEVGLKYYKTCYNNPKLLHTSYKIPTSMATYLNHYASMITIHSMLIFNIPYNLYYLNLMIF